MNRLTTHGLNMSFSPSPRARTAAAQASRAAGCSSCIINKINDGTEAAKTFKASMWLRIKHIKIKTYPFGHPQGGTSATHNLKEFPSVHSKTVAPPGSRRRAASFRICMTAVPPRPARLYSLECSLRSAMGPAIPGVRMPTSKLLIALVPFVSIFSIFIGLTVSFFLCYKRSCCNLAHHSSEASPMSYAGRNLPRGQAKRDLIGGVRWIFSSSWEGMAAEWSGPSGPALP
jgi:hypothetical protein